MKTASKTTVVAEGLILTVITTIIWSIVPVCIKVILRALDPFTIALTRFVLATVVVWLVLQKREARRLNAGDKFWIVLGGAGMAGNYNIYNIALQHTTASAANLVVQIEMVGLIILSRLILKEKLGTWKIIGILVTMAGITIVFSGNGYLGDITKAEYMLGNAIIMIAGISWSFYGLAQKMLANRHIPTTQGLVGIFGVAAIFSIGPTLAFHESRGHITPLMIACLIIISVFSTGIGYLLLGKAFRLLDASTVVATSSLLPIFTIISARILISELLTVNLLIGALLVVGGILTIAKQDTRYGPESNA